MRLLIVDSDIPLILKLKKAFEELEYEVRAVGRPRPALNTLQENTYNVAVVDLYVERTDIPEFIAEIRNIQPDMPVILSGRYEEDLEMVTRLKAQGYIHKPYTARKLAPIIEKVLKRQHSSDIPYDTGSSALDILLENALARAEEEAYEPPPPEDATIGQLVSALHEASTAPGEQAESVPGEDSPEEKTPPATEQNRLDEDTAENQDTASFPATSALRLSHEENLNNLLSRIEDWARETGNPPLQPLPSWQAPQSSEEAIEFEHMLDEIQPPDLPEPIPDDLFDSILEPPPASMDTRQFIYEPPPTDEATTDRIWSQARIDIEPDPPGPDENPDYHDELDPELIDALADAEDLNDPRLQDRLKQFAGNAPDEEQDLVSVPVEEITRAMGVVTDEEIDNIPPDESDDENSRQLIAHAAFKLTEISLESTAIGILLIQDDRIIDRSGDMPDELVNQIFEVVYAAWQREGDSRTRLLYRDIETTGEVLIYSTHSVDDLTLTMIFAADTPLRIIRRQARRISEALASVPDEVSLASVSDEHVVESPASVQVDTGEQDSSSSQAIEESSAETAPPVDHQEEEIPEAARTLPGRPTDPLPPPGLKDAIADQQPEEREPGTYTDYACLWLLADTRLELTDQGNTRLEDWLIHITAEKDWDIIDLKIDDIAVNIHLSLPVTTSPGDAIPYLMEQTSNNIQESLGRNPDAYPSIWVNSYSVSMPGRLLNDQEIKRFIQFYQEKAEH